MICFICQKTFQNLDILVKHLKLFHCMKTNSLYTCRNCSGFQHFQNISTFKKHMKIKHFKENLLSNPKKTKENSTNVIQNNTYNYIENKSTIETTANENTINDSSNEMNIDTIEQYIHNIRMAAVKFNLSLHNFNNFNVKDIFTIQNSVYDNILKAVSSFLTLYLSSKILDPNLLSDVKGIISAINNPFVYCKTEYSLTDHLTKNDLINKLDQFTINNEIEERLDVGELTYGENHSKGTLISLHFQFRKIFEKESNLNDSLEAIRKWENDSSSISNFVQGDLWKKKKSLYPNKIVMPYFLYFDDAEINNPLGSHATVHSIGAVYYSFPLLKNTSKLSNIFIAGFLKSSDLKSYGNDPCFYQLIDNIIDLEKNGILIKTHTGSYITVHFILGIILGDNLGLNTILDFSKSFSANHFCRFCKEPKISTQYLCEENIDTLRNKTNYDNDLQLQDFTKTGINKRSIFNSIMTFHAVENFSVDIMHDIFEGICHYNMSHIILHYIENNVFTLEMLNNRKQLFNYGSSEVGNLSGVIKSDHLKKKHLKMSAREMMTFVHHFSLMVGDFVPENDDIWSFYILFLNIIDSLTSSTFNEDSIILLQHQIKEHNTKFIELFGDTLKPKYHILTHYPTIIRQSGPPKHFWSFRFEAKHRELKMYCRSTNSRRNIPYTLAKKFEYKFANFIISPQVKELIITENFKRESIFKEFLNTNFRTESSSYSQIQFNGTIYKIGLILSLFTDKLNLYEIIEIVVTDGNIFVLCNNIDHIVYNSHFDAYEIPNNLDNQGNIIPNIYNIKDFNSPPLHANKLPHNKQMVRLKNFF